MSALSPPMDPVRFRCGPDGRLLAADAPAMRLHLEAGGEVGGIIALPPLLLLTQLCARLRMRLARPVTIVTDRERILLWVESVWDNDAVDHLVSSWREVPLDADGHAADPARHDADGRMVLAVTADLSAQVDAAMRVLWVRGLAGDAGGLIGCSLTAVLDPARDGDGRMPLIEALAERQPFVGQVAVDDMGRRYMLSGRPLTDAGGLFAGYLIEGERIVAPVAPLTDVPLGFGADLAPALRQPLGAIIANAHTIGDRLLGTLQDSYASYAADIAAAARHLLTLIEDLTDLEALERPDFTVADDQIDLADCARRVAQLLSVRAGERGIVIHAPDETAVLPAHGEFRRVLQILVNLVGNAIRYANANSTIAIDVDALPDAGMACVRVSDEGPGLDEAAQTRIFDKFERLGRTGDGGSGLGLYIARRLARAMGGDLTVMSSPGAGAAFTLSLPARAD